MYFQQRFLPHCFCVCFCASLEKQPALAFPSLAKGTEIDDEFVISVVAIWAN
jgi:hypothetical protein